jgi:phosphoglycerate dehydrogenase-like enzyme
MNVLISIYSPIASWNIPDAQVDRLRRDFPRHRFVQARSAEETAALAPEADVAFSSLIRADALRAAARLRWIHSPAAGVGSMLTPELRARDLLLTNSRGTHADAMAEHVLGLVLALFRKLPESAREQAARRWAHDDLSQPPPFRLVRGSVVGIVGSGAIGSAIARLASAFGARVEAIRRRPELGAPDGVTAVFAPGALASRLGHWDVVVLAAPLTPETHGLIGRAELEAMKPDAVLVNVGRGKLVREADLIDALRAGRLRAAALDVVEREPLDPASPLWAMPNVLITPHTSSLRADYWDLATDLFIENLRRFDRGEPLLNVVDQEAGY